MDPKHITLIKDADLGKDDYTMKVRIIRLWKRKDLRNPKEIFSIEMIIMDEQGSKLEANVPKKCIAKFDKLVKEQCDYYIQNGSLGLNSTTYKYVDNVNKLCFNHKTKVTKCNDFNGTIYGFSFTTFKTIWEEKLSTENIDVIGYVVRFFKMETYHGKKDKQSKKMTVQLQDLENEKIYVTLWDDYAQQMSDYISNNLDESCIILIIQFGKMKFFNENPYVSNSYNVTRLFINTEIDEIMAFKKSLLDNESAGTSSSFRSISSVVIYSLHDDFLINNDFNTIAEIHEISMPKTVIILGTIKRVCDDVEWYYLGCKKCTSRASSTFIIKDKPNEPDELEEEEIFECRKCNIKMITPTPRFKIQIRVQDMSGVASLTLFDRDARKLIKQSAKDIPENIQEAGDLDIYPNVLYQLNEKRYAFKIEVTSYNLEKNVPVYGIRMLTNDSEIITELEKRIPYEEPVLSDSANGPTSAFPSQETVNLKDVVSCTAENVTPISNLERSTETSHLICDKRPTSSSTRSDLKRKLDDVYDVEDLTSMSATKQSMSSLTCYNGDGKGDGKEKLLTPKIEK